MLDIRGDGKRRCDRCERIRELEAEVERLREACVQFRESSDRCFTTIATLEARIDRALWIANEHMSRVDDELMADVVAVLTGEGSDNE